MRVDCWAQPQTLCPQCKGIYVVLVWPRPGCGLGTEPGRAGRKVLGSQLRHSFCCSGFLRNFPSFWKPSLPAGKMWQLPSSPCSVFGMMIHLGFGQHDTEGIHLQLRNTLLTLSPFLLLCRKGTLLINNLFSIAAAILMGTSEIAKTFEVIILSRVIMGIFAGKWMVKGEQ